MREGRVHEPPGPSENGIRTRRQIFRLPYEYASARTARHLLTDDLEHAGAPLTLKQDARLVISELVTNGVEHGEPLPDHTIAVTWTLNHRSVEICVSDGGPTRHLRPAAADKNAPRGRGLALVEMVSTRWWTENGQHTTICALLTTEPLAR